MKIDYSSWSTRLLSIDNLKLDVKNPRFSYQSTKEMNQTEIVKYLIENHAVYELAKAIAINGYLLNEEPIVCKEGDSYVVLDLKSASNLNGNLNCSKELEHYAS